MRRLFDWIKQNKIASIIIVLLLLFLLGKNLGMSSRPQTYEYNTVGVNEGQLGFRVPSFGTTNKMAPMAGSSAMMTDSYAPSTSANRLVIQESTMSMLVDNVQQVQEQILQKTKQLGGFMVNTSINNPQEAATATVVIRVPATQLETALTDFRGLAVKVISENLHGEDVTDQYSDIQASMATLQKTKVKFEEILDKATRVQDILDVQRELINLQSQIDSLKGQEQYYERNAEMSKLTIYLSTDELALPYQPGESWRPELIFKQAVRSVISSFRKVGTLLIWLAVYSIIWVPVLGIIYFLKRRKSPSAPRM